MNEDRMKILQMLQDGKISADEAARLLEAMEADDLPTRTAVTPVVYTDNVGDKEADENYIDSITPTKTEQSPLASAFLLGARLDGAQLDGAQLHGAFLLGADLRDADLRNADLRGAFLAFVDLKGANLYGANLNSAFMPFANGVNGNLANSNFASAFMPFMRFFRHQTKVV